MPGPDAPETFGARLRAAREGRGISLREIANATKISVAALDALERNDVSRLPGGIFSRAFVRSYAVEVGLDPEETLARFAAQFPHEPATPSHSSSAHHEDHVSLESDRRLALTFLRILALSIPLVAIVVYFGASARRGNGAAEVAPPPKVSVPVPQPAVPQPKEEAVVAPPAATDATPVGNVVDGRGAASPVPAAATAGAATPAVSAAANAATALVRDPATTGAEDVLTILVVASRPCWLSATVDGERAIQRLFQPGEERRVEVRREMTITAGDAAAVSLTLNGAPARALGKSGDVVTVKITPANFKDYLRR